MKPLHSHQNLMIQVLLRACVQRLKCSLGIVGLDSVQAYILQLY